MTSRPPRESWPVVVGLDRRDRRGSRRDCSAAPPRPRGRRLPWSSVAGRDCARRRRASRRRAFRRISSWTSSRIALAHAVPLRHRLRHRPGCGRRWAMTSCAGAGCRSGAALALTGLVTYFGVAASYGVASFHYEIWDRHRDAIAEILEIAPRVEPDTVIVYTDVPAFSRSLRRHVLVRPGGQARVPGGDGRGGVLPRRRTAGPRGKPAFRRGRWVETGRGAIPWLDGSTLANTVFVAYGRHGRVCSTTPPLRFRTAITSAAVYEPETPHRAGPADARAVRRYGPVDEDGDG